MRTYTLMDRVILGLGRGLNAVHGEPQQTQRENPASGIPETDMDDRQRKHVAGLMRVNHAGEVAAQALYHGQAITARDEVVKKRLEKSADEEGDHLAWCQERVDELGSQTSLFGPVWYWGSFTIGAIAGTAGDKWSLGFIKETEDQVIEHLKGHLVSIPDGDEKSRAIIQQMMIDEEHHGDMAVEAGGVPLPSLVKLWMQLTAKVMTATSYRI